MKSQYRTLFGFVTLLVSVSLACSVFTPAEPTAVPTNPPPPTAAPLPTVAPLPTSDVQVPNPSGPSNPAGGNQPAGNSQTSGTSSDIVTFVDENDLFGFDLPGDWFYEHNAYDNYYVDTFTSPDEASAKIESIVYNDGTAFDNSDSAATALAWLNQFYSNTGQEGDIRVSKHQVEKDGSESLEWSSKGGDYSGKTFFEVRGDNRKTFMLFTVWYINDIDQATLDVVNNAVNTYYIP